MSKKTEYCQHCGDDRAYTTYDLIRKTTVKGKDIVYNYKEAICNTCKGNMYVHEINNLNLEELYSKIK